MCRPGARPQQHSRLVVPVRAQPQGGSDPVRRSLHLNGGLTLFGRGRRSPSALLHHRGVARRRSVAWWPVPSHPCPRANCAVIAWHYLQTTPIALLRRSRLPPLTARGCGSHSRPPAANSLGQFGSTHIAG